MRQQGWSGSSRTIGTRSRGRRHEGAATAGYDHDDGAGRVPSNTFKYFGGIDESGGSEVGPREASGFQEGQELKGEVDGD